MKILRHILLTLVLLGDGLIAMAQMLPESMRPEVTVVCTVIDGEGRPVPGAEVSASWTNVEGDRLGGTTGDDGKITLSGKQGGSLYVKVEKRGYYETGGELWTGGFTSSPASESDEAKFHMNVKFDNLVLQKPPDSFTVELEKIVDPVPMYVKRVETELPKLNEPVGLDLEKGDWVEPHGGGKVEDLLLTGSVEVRGIRDYDASLKIEFSERMDGYVTHRERSTEEGLEIASELYTPQRAPVTGFNNELIIRKSRTPENPKPYSYLEGTHYLMRIRTKFDNAGNIEQANYARTDSAFKLLNFIKRGSGPRDYTASGKMDIEFTYYYNPDPDPENRSLEWSGENLFLKGMSESERRRLDRELREDRLGGLSMVYPEIPEDRRPKPLKSGDSR